MLRKQAFRLNFATRGADDFDRDFQARRLSAIQDFTEMAGRHGNRSGEVALRQVLFIEKLTECFHAQ